MDPLHAHEALNNEIQAGGHTTGVKKKKNRKNVDVEKVGNTK